MAEVEQQLTDYKERVNDWVKRKNQTIERLLYALHGSNECQELSIWKDMQYDSSATLEQVKSEMQKISIEIEGQLDTLTKYTKIVMACQNAVEQSSVQSFSALSEISSSRHISRLPKADNAAKTIIQERPQTQDKVKSSSTVSLKHHNARSEKGKATANAVSNPPGSKNQTLTFPITFPDFESTACQWQETLNISNRKRKEADPQFEKSKRILNLM